MGHRDPQRPFAGRVNRILNVMLIGFCLLLVRSWHLSVIQHDARVAEAARPKRKSVWVHPKRGMILDRDGLPLAMNGPNFRVGILYSAIRDVPRVSSIVLDGKRMRIRSRSQYITSLSEALAQCLPIAADRIEDLIHARAALFPHLPCVIHEHLSPEQYGRLKLMEKDWLGLVVEAVPERIYPAGASAAHVVGYMGRLSAEEFHAWQRRLNLLEQAEEGQESALVQLAEEGIMPHQVSAERLALRRQGYVPADWSGKAGAERSYEGQLRGLCGLEVFEADTSGRRLRELAPEVPMEPGSDLRLSISLPLQAYAERLLRQAEQRHCHPRAPAIKGGGIVVMDPRTGEVLALAGYPSYDPNQFIRGGEEVLPLLENESWLAKVWDGLLPLPAQPPRAEAPLTWDVYLETTFGRDHALTKLCQRLTVGEALKAMHDLPADRPLTDEQLNGLCQGMQGMPPSRPLRLLALDLLRVVAGDLKEAPAALAGQKLRVLHQTMQDLQIARKQLRERAKVHFAATAFKRWRTEESKRWLQQQRKEEHRAKRPHRPYLDLLDQEEHRQFQLWWDAEEWTTLLALLRETSESQPPWLQEDPHLSIGGKISPSSWKAAVVRLQQMGRLLGEETQSVLMGLRSFYQLNDSLIGRYPFLRGPLKAQSLKELATAFYPPFGVGYLRSQAYQQVAPLGSTFKLVTAFEALRQSEERWGRPRPQEWTIVEDLVSHGARIAEVGHFADGRVIPRIYQGGRLPLTVYRHFGTMDFLSAVERSSNPYFALLTVEAMRRPTDLLEAARLFGLGQRTGIRLYGESPGRLPTDLETNRSGLYEFSMGQHEFRGTPLQTACFVSALANGGDLLTPSIQWDTRLAPRRHIPISSEVRQLILQGMRRVITGKTGTARAALVRRDPISAEAHATYERMAPYMVAKTGTAQILETLTPDPEQGVQMVTHVSFATIIYPSEAAAESFKSPELVVVVSLRFAHGGREAAPLAAQVAEYWRSLRDKKKQ
ncbi:MAG: penicillin-binding transpeptidase domain-containing protein [Chlamydiia bacterium]